MRASDSVRVVSVGGGHLRRRRLERLITIEAKHPAPPPGVAALRHRRVQVIRDYGMHDRREAPQYLPDVPAQSSNDSASNAP